MRRKAWKRSFARLIPYATQRHGQLGNPPASTTAARDKTLIRLKEWHQRDGRIKILSLSRNFGKEAALTAGLELRGRTGRSSRSTPTCRTRPS